MMQLTSAMVGMLGGPALQVLVILTIERGARSLSFLQDMTGLSDKTLHQATRKLHTLGYLSEITINREKIFCLTGELVQLPFGAEQIEAETEPEPEAEPEQEPKTEEENVFRKFSERPLNESMNQSDIDSIENDSLLDSGDFRKNSGSGDEPITQADLAGLGFYGRGLADLLHIPGLTLFEVQWQARHAPSLGCALARLKKRQPLPADALERAGPDSRNQYIGGEFAEFIQH